MKHGVIISLVLSLALCLIMPFNVIYADNETYSEVSGCNTIAKRTGYNTYYHLQTDNPVRLVVLHGSSRTTFYTVSTDNYSVLWGINSSSSCFANSSNDVNVVSYDNTQYYVQSFSFQPSVNVSDIYFSYVESEIQSNELAIRYSYGDLAVGESVSYGDLTLGYSTKFVTSNFEGFNDENIDTITWSNVDTNGNFLNGVNVDIEIRAVPSYYIADSQAVLLQQDITNLLFGVAMLMSDGSVNVSPVEYFRVYKGSINRMEFSIKWSDVINTFPNAWLKGALASIIQDGINSVYYKTGWIYQARFLVDEDSDNPFISEWQTIYQVSSVAPETSTTIIQQVPNGLSPELYNLLQTVNTLNNTVQNWNINGVPVNMQSQENTSNNKPWYEVLLESITSMINTIIDAIVGLGGDIIKGLFDLVNNLGVNVLGIFTDLWNNLTQLFVDIDIGNNDDFVFEIPDNADLLSLPKLTYQLFVDNGFSFIVLIPLVFILIGVIL